MKCPHPTSPVITGEEIELAERLARALAQIQEARFALDERCTRAAQRQNGTSLC
jgi:hypothetical protein